MSIKIKKIFMFVAVIFILTLAQLHIFTAAEELELGWSLSKGDIKPGEEVEVTVSLKNYSATSILGIMGMQIDVLLDTDLVQYVASSAKTTATGNSGDMISATYNVTKKKVIFIYISMNDNLSLPRGNTKLFSFKVKALSTITKNTVSSFICTQFAVTDASGDRKITVTNNPSVNILVDVVTTAQPTKVQPTTVLQFLLGDSDQDGKVTVKDATIVQKHVAKIITLKGIAPKAADADQDGKISVKDATAIQKYVAKIKVKFPIGQIITE